MKSTNTFMVVTVLAILISAYYLSAKEANKTNVTSAPAQLNVSNANATLPNPINQKPEGSLEYAISSSSVTSNPTGLLANAPALYNGRIWFHPETNSFGINTNYTNLLTTNLLLLGIVSNDPQVRIANDFELSMPLTMGFNGVDRSEMFLISGYFDEVGFRLTAQTSIALSDYNFDEADIAETGNLVDLAFSMSGELL